MIAQIYRPKTLDEIIGHDGVINEIKERFNKNSYPQVSYFTGITGTGKTTIAYNVAKIIQCENKINNHTPCNQCSFCNDINRESFISGTYMFNASNLDIETMRYIEELTQTDSLISDKKVIIIDEFQELNSNKKAQKNLLKALEKDTDGLHFILLSMDDSKVDKSIKNRSVCYKLYPVDYSEIAKYLYSICEKQNISLTEEQINILFTLSENSGGSVRQACAYLDRVIEGGLWTKEALEKILHFVNDETVSSLCIKLIDSDPSIFGSTPTEEVLQKVRYQLVELAKHNLGVELETYRKNQISKLIGYKKATLPRLKFLINGLNSMFSYPYLNQEIIDTILLNLYIDSPVELNQTPKIETETEEIPKRRRS